MPEQINDFVVAGLGVSTVFVALICIIFICNIMGAIFKRIDRGSSGKQSIGATPIIEQSEPFQPTSAEPYIPTAAADDYVKASIPNRAAVIAAISAAIAEDCGEDISRIRILSVRERANSIPDRAKLCAAISAVISEETGAEYVKIHSIRRLSSVPNRGELCAAISAVISEETGAEHVRVHSIKRI